MKRALNILIGLLVIAYPLLVYSGLHFYSPRYIALGLGFVLLLRFSLIKSQSNASAFKKTLIIGCLAGLAMSIIGALSNNATVIKLYPVIMNALLFIFFGASLLKPPCIIERLARLKEPNLPKRAVAYTETVTAVWCGFFLVNGSIALYTCFLSSNKIWALYNGLISYLLIGLLFVGEWIVRQRVKEKTHA